MATHPGMLLAYDADGNVVATLDFVVAYNPDGTARGLVDFAATEEAGIELTNIWRSSKAVGSKSWPEYLGVRAHEYRVERNGPPGRRPIVALVHKETGERRERAQIEARIAQRLAEAGDRPADIRDIVGGPGKVLKDR